MKHTQEPWILDKPREGEHNRFVFRDDSLGRTICEVYYHPGFANGKETTEANARLIAAAPDLLVACKALLAAVKAEPIMNHHRYDQLGIQVNAAIAKAEAS